MKKTKSESHPQFIREREFLERNNNFSMDKNSVYINGNGRSARHKKRQKNQAILIISLIAVISMVCLIILIVRNVTKKPAQSSSITSSLINSSNTKSMSGSSNSESSSTVSKSASHTASQPSNSPMTTQQRSQAFSNLQKEISDLASEFDGRIGVYYINLKNGEKWGLGESQPFVAASSIKLGINTLLYDKVAKGVFKFTDMLSYNNKPYPQGDMEPGTGSIIGQPNGTKFSIRRTSQLSITISDNCATNMIIRKLGGIDAIVPYLSGISNAVPYRTAVTYKDYNGTLISGRHRTSAIDLAMHAKNLYTLWTENKAAYDPLMTDLKSTVFDFGIQSLLPSSVSVAHKIGTNGTWKTENDVGIVFAKEPYVICVTTENSSQQAGRDTVADISLMFYEYVTSVSK